MKKIDFIQLCESTLETTTQYVPSYPWKLGTEEIPNPDDLADWD